MTHFRLDYQDGDFTLVFPLPIKESRKVAVYHQELRGAVAGLHVWPEDLDSKLYPLLKIYYHKIAVFFEINPDQLTQESRHHFFIATEPIEYKNQLIPGLSLLEKLLGYDYPKEDASELVKSSEEIITTGDPSLDIIADAILIFKIGGLENHYSLDELAKLCKQANERLKQAEESARGETKGGDENLESEALDEDFVKDKSRLYNWLTNLGIAVPVEF